MIRDFSAARRPIVTILGGALAALLWIAPRPAEAQVQAFQEAREAYRRGDYPRVIDILQPLVGGEVPAMTDAILVEPSRRYLGAAYALTGQVDDAEAVFEALLRDLLRDEPDRFEGYTLDPATFLDRVHTVFNRVHARLAEEVRQQQLDEEQRDREARERRREALLSLLELSQEDEVEVERDPTPTYVPFGVGQFHNGDEDLGYFFLISQATMLLSSIVLGVTWLVMDQEFSPLGPGDEARRDGLRAVIYTNWASAGAFTALAIAGIIEARTSFVPRITIRRRREIPDDILQELELGLGPGGLTLSGRF